MQKKYRKLKGSNHTQRLLFPQEGHIQKTEQVKKAAKPPKPLPPETMDLMIRELDNKFVYLYELHTGFFARHGLPTPTRSIGYRRRLARFRYAKMSLAQACSELGLSVNTFKQLVQHYRLNYEEGHAELMKLHNDIQNPLPKVETGAEHE